MDATKARRDLAYSFGALFGYKLVGFAVLVLLARYLTKDDFGRIMFAISLATTAGFCTEFGSGNYLVRRVSKEPARALQATGLILWSRVPIVIAYLVLLNGIVAMTNPDLLAVVAPISMFAALKEIYGTYHALFLGLKRVTDTILTHGGAQIVLLVCVVIATVGGLGLHGVTASYVVSGVVMIAGSLVLVRRIGPIPRERPAGTMRLVIAAALPLFILTLLEFVQWRVDTLMLGWYVSYEAVAVYEAGGKLVETSQFLVRPLTMIFFPICAALAGDGNLARLRGVARRLLFISTGLGALIALALVLTASWIVPLAFGAEYARSAPVLVALAPVVPLLFVTAIATFVATALHLERWAGIGVAAAVGIHVVLNALWIPDAGALGAARAFLVSQAFVVVWLVVLCERGMR